MTGRRKHSGPRKKLTDEQAAALRVWGEEVRKLGKRKDAMARAARLWKLKRRALGNIKAKSAEMGVCKNTILDYVKGNHKS